MFNICLRYWHATWVVWAKKAIYLVLTNLTHHFLLELTMQDKLNETSESTMRSQNRSTVTVTLPSHKTRDGLKVYRNDISFPHTLTSPISATIDSDRSSSASYI